MVVDRSRVVVFLTPFRFKYWHFLHLVRSIEYRDPEMKKNYEL